ncbi:MAG: glutathione transferase [Gammaproteobacteria bacterium]
MSIVFYGGSGSPFVWTVWLALEHKGLDYDIKLLSFEKKQTRTPEFIAINPRHKVPTLVDNEFVIYEASAIVEYLEERFPSAGYGTLFPGDIKQRATTRRVIAEVNNYMPQVTGKLLKEIFFKPEGEQNAELITQIQQEYLEQLAFFEALLHGKFLVGQLSAADYTLYPQIALALRLEKQNPSFALSTHLSDRWLQWLENIEQLPYYQKTYPPHWK